MLIRRLVALLVPVLVSFPAPAGMLYKSVGANGTIIFSDTPPASGARLIEQKHMTASGSVAPAPRTGASLLESSSEFDAAIARANAQVDAAEHAVAVARQGLWSPGDGLRLTSVRMSSEAAARVEYCKQGVIIARQMLLDVMRERRGAMILASR